MERLGNDRSYSVCRICEKQIKINELKMHSAKCLRINELKSKLVAVNKELNDYSNKAIQLKLDILKGAIIAKKRSTMNSPRDNSKDKNPGMESIELDLPISSKYAPEEVTLVNNEYNGDNEPKCLKMPKRGFKNLKVPIESIEPKIFMNSPRRVIIEDERDQYHQLVLHYVMKYLERVNDKEDLDCDISTKREIEDMLQKVEKPTLHAFLAAFIQKLNTKIMIKMQLGEEISKGATNESNKVKLFRSFSEVNNSKCVSSFKRNKVNYTQGENTPEDEEGRIEDDINGDGDDGNGDVCSGDVNEIWENSRKGSKGNNEELELEVDSCLINNRLSVLKKHKEIEDSQSPDKDTNDNNSNNNISSNNELKDNVQCMMESELEIESDDMKQDFDKGNPTTHNSIEHYPHIMPNKPRSYTVWLNTKRNLIFKHKRHSSLIIIKDSKRCNNNMRVNHFIKANKKHNIEIDMSSIPKNSLTVIYESPSNKGYFSNRSRCHESYFDSFSQCSTQDVTIEDFEFIKMIAKGGYGRVWLVRKKQTGDLYAMKIVEITEMIHGNRLANLKAERDIFQVLEGDSVVKAVFTFIYKNYVCFVMEYMIGGDFGKILDKFGYLNEDIARFYFSELILAVESIHSLGIIHRDLKPENILLDMNGHIKLADFGLSEIGFKKKTSLIKIDKGIGLFPKLETYKRRKAIKFFNDLCNKEINDNTLENQLNVIITDKTGSLKELNDFTTSFKDKKFLHHHHHQHHIEGTPDYIAPEVLNNVDDMNSYAIDWWSMGVILYEFVIGITPFNDETVEKVFDNIRNYRIDWPAIGNEEGCISGELANLIQRFLDPNPRTRLGSNGIDEIKNHEFFAGYDWDNIKSREAPIALFPNKEMTIIMSNTNEASNKIAVVFKEPEEQYLEKKSVLEKYPNEHIPLKIDMDAFKMKRMDLLHHLNEREGKLLINVRISVPNLNS